MTGQNKAMALVVALRSPALDLLQTIPLDKQEEYMLLIIALEKILRCPVKVSFSKPGKTENSEI